MGWIDLAMLAIGSGVGAAISVIGTSRTGRHQQRQNLVMTSPAIAVRDGGLVNADHSDQTTKLQQLEAQLQQTQAAYQLAKQAEQFKAGFLARTSHELRSPLNSIMSLQQLILADLCEDSAEEREFIAQAYTASQKMLGLLDRLISVSKATYGSEQLQLQPVSLEDVLMEVESLTMLQAQNRSQRLKISYPDSDIWVIADPRWLKQVLVSLIDTPSSLMQEGEICLTPQVGEQTVNILIEDERPVSSWSEPLELLQTLRQKSTLDSTATKPDIASLTDLGQLPSAGLALFVNQTILELMHSSLDVLKTPSAEQPKTLIQCSLPLVTEE
jgi:signal transduction histidine kinase